MIPKHKHQSYKKCYGACEDARDVAMMMVKGNKYVRAAAMLTIKKLHSACRSCCNGGFYKNCIAPLARYVQPPHDHMFPDESDDLINNYRVYTPEDWARDHYNEVNRYWDNVYNYRFG